ncbi:MAG TPA: hypothetical protein VGF30_10630 [Bacteroidia bacterium]
MKPNTKVAIWMDNSIAYIRKFGNNNNELTIKNEESVGDRKDVDRCGGDKGSIHAQYYTDLGEIIMKYKEVTLIGPTNDKQKLLDVLRANHLFSQIKIILKNSFGISQKERDDYYFTHPESNLQ